MAGTSVNIQSHSKLNHLTHKHPSIASSFVCQINSNDCLRRSMTLCVKTLTEEREKGEIWHAYQGVNPMSVSINPHACLEQTHEAHCALVPHESPGSSLCPSIQECSNRVFKSNQPAQFRTGGGTSSGDMPACNSLSPSPRTKRSKFLLNGLCHSLIHALLHHPALSCLNHHRNSDS